MDKERFCTTDIVSEDNQGHAFYDPYLHPFFLHLENKAQRNDAIS